MDRDIAVAKLSELVGQNLHELAQMHKINVHIEGRQNKGWAGHVFERHLGLPLNSAQAPNFGSWELKSFPITFKNGLINIKETMAVTMIDPVNVLKTDFADSYLLNKLKRTVCVVRNVGKSFMDPCYIHAVKAVDLSSENYNIIEQDYEQIREVIRNRGFNALSGSMGTFVQPRTKGPGHGSISRAFYARKAFLKEIVE